MKSKSAGSNAYAAMGAISLSVMLVVLTIAAFAVLTYISADSDYKLSVKAAQSVTERYAAETAANRTLASVADIIGTAGWRDALSGMGCAASYANGTYTISFSQPVNAQKTLKITVYATDKDHFEILEWQTATSVQ